MKLSPASRIGIGFGSALVLLPAIVFASVWTTFRLRATVLSADHALQAANFANDLHMRLGILQRSVRAYLVGGESKLLAHCDVHKQAIKQDLAHLRDLNAEDPVLRARLDSIEFVMSRIAVVHDRLIAWRSERELTPPELLEWYDEVTDLNSQVHHALDDKVEARDRFRLAADTHRAKIFATSALYINSLGGMLAIFSVVAAAVITVRDARARWRAEDQLEYQAFHDALTGLPNRFHLHRKLEQLIGSSRANGGSFAILLIDLDRFKDINDSFGHHYGDLVLQTMNHRLGAGLRTTDLVARLGGDEFAILLPRADCETANAIAERIWANVRRPIEIDGHRLAVGASIGIALFPEHGQDARELFQRADVAMYASKRRRREKPVFKGVIG
jgi:diguanylate cyclase (GGDEF)-like protein